MSNLSPEIPVHIIIVQIPVNRAYVGIIGLATTPYICVDKGDTGIVLHSLIKHKNVVIRKRTGFKGMLIFRTIFDRCVLSFGDGIEKTDPEFFLCAPADLGGIQKFCLNRVLYHFFIRIQPGISGAVVDRSTTDTAAIEQVAFIEQFGSFVEESSVFIEADFE